MLKKGIAWAIILVFILIGGLGAFNNAIAKSAKERSMTLRFGHPVPATHPICTVLDKWVAYIEKESGGTITIETYPQCQLGGERAMFDQVIAGTLDISMTGSPILATAVPELNCFCLPFLFENEDQFYRMVKVQEVQDRFRSIIEKKAGVVMLGIWSGNARGLLNKVKEIRGPKDLAGLKIRVMEGNIYTDIFQAMGAVTATIPFPELYAALQQGVVDGEDNTPDMGVAMKFFEIEKFFTDTNQTMQINPLLMSMMTWERLSDKQKKVVMDSIYNVLIPEIEPLGKHITASSLKTGEEKYGVKVTHLTDEERAVFTKITQPVHEKYKPQIGNEFYDWFVGIAEQCK